MKRIILISGISIILFLGINKVNALQPIKVGLDNNTCSPPPKAGMRLHCSQNNITYYCDGND